MRKRLLFGCALPLIVVGLLVYYGTRGLFKPTVTPGRSETAHRGDVEIKVVESGAIEPLRKVDVKSKVGGRVSRLFVDEGASVRQGQVLATIDPQEINSQVAALRAQLAAAQARLEEARKNVGYQRDQTTAGIEQYVQNAAAAKAHLDQAEVEANVQPNLTNQTIAIAKANLDAAHSALDAQQSNLDLMIQSTHPQAVVSAQAAFDEAKAQAENAARNIQRQKQLLVKGFVAQQVVDSAETDAKVADAHLADAQEHLSRIKQANALEEANARSQIASAKSQVRQMEAALEQAQVSVLPITTQRLLDNARAAYAQAKAQLAAARSGRTQDRMRQDEVDAASAEVLQLQSQLKDLLIQQNDTTLTATMSGVITKRYVETGELISSAISTFSSGSPVYQIADLATMLVKINVNEVDIGKIKPGLRAEVTLDSVRGVTFPGHVRKVSPAATGSATGDTNANSGGSSQGVVRFPVEIQIDRADRRLKPGMSARCAVIVARRRGVLRLPTNCVQGTGAKSTIQVVISATKDGSLVETTVSRPVTVGLRGDEWLEIVSGLKEGEKVRPSPYKGPPRAAIDLTGPG